MDALLSNIQPSNELITSNDDVISFQPAKTDSRYLSNNFTVITPQEPITPTGSTYNFELPSSLLPRYTHINQLYCSLGLTLMKKEEGKTEFEPVEQADNVAPCAYLLDSFFSQIDIFLNDRCVTSSNSYRDISSVLAKRLFFGKAPQETFLRTECCFPDTINADLTMNNSNLGFEHRKTIFSKKHDGKAPMVQLLGKPR